MSILDAAEAAAESQEPNDNQTQPPESNVSEPADFQDEQAQPSEAMNRLKRKRRNKGAKSVAQRGPTALPKNRGSGFEEYFADPPMTPQEADEEKGSIYAEDLPFEERIQSCIQRFRARRRIQGPMIRFFNEYLFFGGVDSTPGAFNGVDPRDLKGLTPAERREAMASDFIHSGSAAGDKFYNGDAESWCIDFEGVAAGFFSVGMIPLTGFDKVPIEAAIGVVENFLRYVLHHDVCPEFADNVKDALQVCSDAREEWPLLYQLGAALPGYFNLAATKLFSPHTTKTWSSPSSKAPKGFNSLTSFYVTRVLLGILPDAPVGMQDTKTNEYDFDLELVDIIRPGPEERELFRTVTVDENHPGLPPVGRVVCQLTTIEDEWDHADVPRPFADVKISLYFEDSILANLRVGMKMSVRLCEMNHFYFVKAIHKIVPSFYTFPPQVLMRHFKQPRENERPAPSIHRLDTNDGQDGEGAE